MNFGIDCLLNDPVALGYLKTRRVGLVAHPASVTRNLVHTMDALHDAGITLSVAFGPQHGLKGDKQDNMIESEDYVDSHQIPIISLYGEHRVPTDEMMQTFDVLLFDLQDLGCRIYTFITTLHYFLQACDRFGKELWILDRPNPAGRPIEGLTLKPGQQSFVGCDEMIMRHGLTLGEFSTWVVGENNLSVDLKVIEVEGYHPTQGPGFGWPSDRAWINPSPNAANLNMARCYSGTVLLEGTTLSEGRGTTRPLEVIGAPDLAIGSILQTMNALAPAWMQGVAIRPCFFEPTFHKHKGDLCAGIQLHTDVPDYDHLRFKPFRLTCLFLKALRQLEPDYDLWRNHAYEYELDRRPIDVINGGEQLRDWVDDGDAAVADLEQLLIADEQAWAARTESVLLYR